MDPLVLLWLSQTRADRVEEFLDGAPSANGGASTAANGSAATATTTTTTAAVNGAANGGVEEGVVIKKARAIFPDDFINENSIKLGPCSRPRTAAVGVKKEAAESTSRQTNGAATSNGTGLAPVARKRAAYQAAAGGPVPVSAESSNEVSSSQTGTGISPVPSLNSSEIGEVDLEFWDLDINESSSASQSSGNRGARAG